MYRFLQKFQYWMMGRNGTDQLSIALMILGLIISFAARFAFSIYVFWFLVILSYVLYAFMLFRVFSKNIAARRKENQKFLKVWNPVSKWLSFQKTRFRDRKMYKYFSCPNCKQHLRAPKGRGKIEVTCQRCHSRFIKKV